MDLAAPIQVLVARAAEWRKRRRARVCMAGRGGWLAASQATTTMAWMTRRPGPFPSAPCGRNAERHPGGPHSRGDWPTLRPVEAVRDVRRPDLSDCRDREVVLACVCDTEKTDSTYSYCKAPKASWRRFTGGLAMKMGNIVGRKLSCGSCIGSPSVSRWKRYRITLAFSSDARRNLRQPCLGAPGPLSAWMRPASRCGNGSNNCRGDHLRLACTSST